LGTENLELGTDSRLSLFFKSKYIFDPCRFKIVKIHTLCEVYLESLILKVLIFYRDIEEYCLPGWLCISRATAEQWKHVKNAK